MVKVLLNNVLGEGVRSTKLRIYIKFIHDIETNPGPGKKMRRQLKLKERRASKLHKQQQIIKSSFIEKSISYSRVVTRKPFQDEPEIVFDDIEVNLLQGFSSVFNNMRSLGNMSTFKDRLNTLAKFEQRRLKRKFFFKETKCKCPRMHTLSCNNNYLIGVELNPGPVFSKMYVPVLPEMDSINNITSEIAKFNKNMDRLCETGLNINHGINLPNLPNLSNFGGDYINIIMDYLRNHKEIGLVIGSTLLATLAFCRISNKLLRACLVFAQSLLVLYLAEPYFKGWIERLLSFTENLFDKADNDCVSMTSEDLETEDVIPEMDYIFGGLPFLGQTISGVFLCLALGKSVTEGQAKKFFQAVIDFPRLSAGFTSVIDFIVELIKRIGMWMLGEIKIKEFPIFADKFPVFTDLQKETADFICLMRSGTPYDYEHAQKCFDLERRVNELIQSIPSGNAEMSNYKREAYLIQQSLKPLLNAFSSENLSGGFRQKPLAIWLSGDSGLGKSTILRRIITDAMALCGTTKEWKKFQDNPLDSIYYYAYENEFWDAYHNQIVTVIDEAGLMREVAGATNDGYMSAIRMVNTVDFPLHMADLAKKGKTSFNSKFLLATSNRKECGDIKSLYYPKAYTNRFKLAFHLICKRDFSKNPNAETDWDREIDWDKVPKYEEGAQLFLDHLIFRLVDLSTGNALKDMEYDEFKLMVVESYEEIVRSTDFLLNTYASDVKAADVDFRAKQKDPIKFKDDLRKTIQIRKDLDGLNINSFFKYNNGYAPKNIQPYSNDAKTLEEGIQFMHKVLEDHINLHKIVLKDLKSIKPYVYTRKLKYLAKRDRKDYFLHVNNRSKIPSEVILDFDQMLEKTKAKSNSSIEDVVTDSDEEFSDSIECEGFWDQYNPKVWLMRALPDAFAPMLHNLADNMGGTTRRIFEDADRMEFVTSVNGIPDDIAWDLCDLYNLNRATFITWRNHSDRLFDVDFNKIDQTYQWFLQDCVLPKASQFEQACNKFYTSIFQSKWVKVMLHGALFISTFYASFYLTGFIIKKLRVKVGRNMDPSVAAYNKALIEEGCCRLCHNNWLFGCDENCNNRNLGYEIYTETESGATKPKKVQKQIRKARKIVKGPKKTEILKYNEEVHNLIVSKTLSNCYDVQIIGINSVSFTAFFFAGKSFVCPEHCFDTMCELYEEDPMLTLKFQPLDGATGKLVLFGDIKDSSVSFGNGDLCAMYVSSMREHANMIKHVIDENDKLLTTARFSGSTPMSKRSGKGVHVVNQIFTPRRNFSTDSTPDSPNTYTSEYGYSGKVQLGKGFCGTLYWATDSSVIGPKIIALHTSGRDNFCFGTGFFKQDLEGFAKEHKTLLYEDSEPPVELFPIDSDWKGVEEEGNFDGHLRVLGCTGNIPSFVKNDVIPSKLNNKIYPSQFEAAKVTPLIRGGVIYDPLSASRKKVSVNEKTPNADLLQCSKDSYFSMAIPNMEPSIYGRNLIPWDEAIGGRSGVMEGMPLSTSPGYPYSEQRKGKGKYFWIGNSEKNGYDLKKPEALSFIKHCEDTVEMMKLGFRPWFFNKDFPKVERRPIGKSTRSVNPHPMDGTAICRRYFGAFCVSFMESRFNIGSALGMNVHGSEWDTLAHLLGTTRKLIAGDYSAWDGRLSPALMSSVLDMINLFYGDCPEEDKLIRKMLLLDLSNSRHISTVYTEERPRGVCSGKYIFSSEETVDLSMFSDIPKGTYKEFERDGKTFFMVTLMYEWDGGMPSGHPLTTIGNIIINHISLRYAIGDILLSDKGGANNFNIKDKNPLRGLEPHLFIICFGDDNVLSLSDHLASKVNQTNLSEALAKIGLVYTDEAKTGATYTHRSLDKISFLKREFVYMRKLGRYVALLEEKVRDEMPQWTHINEKPDAFQQTIDACNRENAYAGETAWQIKFERLCKSLREADCPEFPTEMSWTTAIKAATNLETYHA